MNFLTLDLIKAQARIENDDEDTLLTLYGEAAESKIYSDTGYSYDELLAMSIERNGGTTIDTKLTMAGLMLASTWYKHRENVENVQMYGVSYAYENLIADYVKHTFPEDEEEEEDETDEEE